MTQIAHPELDGIGKYEYGWADKTDAGSNSRRGLNEEVVRDISSKKSEPQWMLDLRLKGLSLFEKKPMPSWGSDLSGIFFDTIKYFVRSTEKQATSWEDLPDDIKNTYDRLGIPEAEKKRLVSGVAAQYESEVVYETLTTATDDAREAGAALAESLIEDAKDADQEQIVRGLSMVANIERIADSLDQNSPALKDVITPDEPAHVKVMAVSPIDQTLKLNKRITKRFRKIFRKYF